jgi:cytochrome c oxidase subunit 2
VSASPAFSALDPGGIQARRIGDLFWTYTGISVVVFALVLSALALAVARRRTPGDVERVELPEAAQRPRRRAVGGASALTVVTLVAMLFLSVLTSRSLASLGVKHGITLEVVGHEWWWEFRYPASVAGMAFTTAYELHVPVGVPIEVTLAADDVIHSFWVPSLQGKRDAIPGKRSSTYLQADQPGRFQGQCAEFCGAQHANMRFVVVAESDADFHAWMRHSLSPAAVPDDPLTRRGLDVFEKTRCPTCHAIGGTDAYATVGPNLTHLASRRDLAMGTVPNAPAHLARWIVDPQSAKPGVIMPGTPLDPADLAALVAYLGSLR